jgi:uncharacterized protein
MPGMPIRNEFPSFVPFPSPILKRLFQSSIRLLQIKMPLSTSQIRNHFLHLSHPEPEKRGAFWDLHVFPEVNWTVMGSTPMSRTYTSLSSFLDATIQVLGKDVLTEPLRLEVKNAVAMPVKGGTYAVVELAAMQAKCQNGMDYNMRYCWVCRYGEDEKIHEARAYIDTDLLNRAITEDRK